MKPERARKSQKNLELFRTMKFRTIRYNLDIAPTEINILYYCINEQVWITQVCLFLTKEHNKCEQEVEEALAAILF